MTYHIHIRVHLIYLLAYQLTRLLAYFVVASFIFLLKDAALFSTKMPSKKTKKVNKIICVSVILAS